VIDASKTAYIDHDVLEIIREFKDVKAPQKNISVVLTGFKAVYNVTNTNHDEGPGLNEGHVRITSSGNHEQLLKELQLN
jgi:carbonic anhydrase